MNSLKILLRLLDGARRVYFIFPSNAVAVKKQFHVIYYMRTKVHELRSIYTLCSTSNIYRGRTYFVLSRAELLVLDQLLFSVYSFQEAKTGRRNVIATGCIDVADYISEESKTFDITVTLKPANKSVLSASIEFSFTSVMLEDGIP